MLSSTALEGFLSCTASRQRSAACSGRGNASRRPFREAHRCTSLRRARQRSCWPPPAPPEVAGRTAPGRPRQEPRFPPVVRARPHAKVCEGFHELLFGFEVGAATRWCFGHHDLSKPMSTPQSRCRGFRRRGSSCCCWARSRSPAPRDAASSCTSMSMGHREAAISSVASCFKLRFLR